MLILLLRLCTVWMWAVTDVSQVHPVPTFRIKVSKVNEYLYNTGSGPTDPRGKDEGWYPALTSRDS
jgi:hypothetical protein